MNLKKVIGLVKEGGEFINEYGPQIAAVGSAVCFVAAIIFAAKESPDAMDALEEKLADNPDMNILEKGATVISRMPKTLATGLSGLALHIFAWKKLLGKLATLTGALALANQDNSNLVKAAKEVVGPDKAKEIVQVKEEISSWENGESWSLSEEDKREVMYPYTWDGLGITVWMTPDEYDERTKENISLLADSEELSIFDYFYIFKCSYPPTQDYGWNCEGRSCGASPSDMLRWAKDELHAELEMHMYKGKYPGYLVKLDHMPSEAVENR